jgi:hypothetical protein
MRHSVSRSWTAACGFAKHSENGAEESGTCKPMDFGAIKAVHAALFLQWLHLSSPLTAGPAGTYLI